MKTQIIKSIDQMSEDKELLNLWDNSFGIGVAIVDLRRPDVLVQKLPDDWLKIYVSDINSKTGLLRTKSEGS